ncbi:hypothetical protein F4775DRAFT_365735 [Biscogniauxia sp. FL1348]|nr:hypothetical protein F4775DRAFT_365735 [Biscogniauxia sp. FL1348]
MLGNSLFECIFIRTCIILLQYTTPLCIAALLFNTVMVNREGNSALSSLSSTTNKILLSYSLIDILYAIFIYIPYRRRLEQEAQHPAPLSPAARHALFYRCLDHIHDPRRYLRLWFLGADEAEMRRENVRDFFLWAFFDSRSDRQLGDDEAAELDGYIDVIEQRTGLKFEPGRGKANGLRLTLDEIEVRYRSVGWYAIMGLIDLFTHCLLAWLGFHYYAQPRSRFLSVMPLRLQDLVSRRRSAAERLSYWHRPHTATDKLPVVFLHGIGIGLSTYMPYLAELNPNPSETEGQIGIIAIEILPISFRLTSAPLSKTEFLDQITAILATHGWDKFVLAAHSYGTFLATHMLQSGTLGPQIDSVLLMDPVSILLHLPDVAYNFTRRQPRQANEWQLWYFASMDPGVAHCLGRHFFWKDNIAWKEDLVQVVGKSSVDGGISNGNRTGERRRRKVAVCLAERDLIVDTIAVARYLAGGDDWMAVVDEDWQRGSPGSAEQDDVLGRGYLTSDGIEILWFPGLDHAQAFDSTRYRNRLSSITRRYCAR